MKSKRLKSISIIALKSIAGFNAIVLTEAQNEFLQLDLSALLNSNGVINEVKRGFLEYEVDWKF